MIASSLDRHGRLIARAMGVVHGVRRQGAMLLLFTGVLLTSQTIGLFVQHPDAHDFGRSFYRSGRAWIEQGEPYHFSGLPNLNPPSLTAMLFVPLARLPLRAAAAMLTAIGVLCVAFTWRWIAVRLSLSQRVAIGSLGVTLCTIGAAGIAWLEGQITWLLLALMAASWLAYRAGDGFRAGLWLGLAVAAKPFFALAALPLGIATLFAAALTAVSISAASVAFTGWHVWRDWLSGSELVSWLGSPGNASIWGLVARAASSNLRAGVTIRQLGLATLVALVCAALAAVVYVVTRTDRDQRWALSVLTAIIFSPLGWTHYLPLVAPPLTAMWARGRWNRWLSVGVVIFCMPPSIGYGDIAGNTWLGGITLGSLYGFGAIFLWVGIAHGKHAGNAATAAGNLARSARTATNDTGVSTSTR